MCVDYWLKYVINVGVNSVVEEKRVSEIWRYMGVYVSWHNYIYIIIICLLRKNCVYQEICKYGFYEC